MKSSIKIKRGVELLNEKSPGWHSKIDLDRLDMADRDDCVLGQLFGDYFDGLEAIGVRPDRDVSFGFNFKVPPLPPTMGVKSWQSVIERSVDRLNKCWKQEITNLREN